MTDDDDDDNNKPSCPIVAGKKYTRWDMYV
jgi:hypothetical protein